MSPAKAVARAHSGCTYMLAAACLFRVAANVRDGCASHAVSAGRA